MGVSVAGALADRDDRAGAAGRGLADTLSMLRGRKDELFARHVRHMWIFGSVARGEDRADRREAVTVF